MNPNLKKIKYKLFEAFILIGVVCVFAFPMIVFLKTSGGIFRAILIIFFSSAYGMVSFIGLQTILKDLKDEYKNVRK